MLYIQNSQFHCLAKSTWYQSLGFIFCDYCPVLSTSHTG